MNNPWRRIAKWVKRLIVGDGQHRRVPPQEWPPGGDADSAPDPAACEGTLIERDFDRARPYTDRPRPGRRDQDQVRRSVGDYYWDAQRRADWLARGSS